MDAGVQGRCVFARHQTVIRTAAHHLARILSKTETSRSRNAS
jgi:hypothetical protein